MFLELPLEDFDELPRQLGCSLHRRRGGLVLSGQRGGCALTFDIDAVRATLSHIAIADDVEGRFTRDVLVPLFIAYGGDLEALLEWSPGRQDPPLIIKAGETQHPLLDQQPELPTALDLRAPMLEQWLHDAKVAWNEYQRLKHRDAA